MAGMLEAMLAKHPAAPGGETTEEKKNSREEKRQTVPRGDRGPDDGGGNVRLYLKLPAADLAAATVAKKRNSTSRRGPATVGGVLSLAITRAISEGGIPDELPDPSAYADGQNVYVLVPMETYAAIAERSAARKGASARRIAVALIEADRTRHRW